MPGMSGFEVLEAIAETRPLVIFTSAYDEYAVKAFDVHAFDYLLKPFDGRRFRDSLQRAKARVEMDRGGVHRDRELHEMFASFSRSQRRRTGSPCAPMGAWFLSGGRDRLGGSVR